MTGAELVVAKIRLQLDELEKTLQAEQPKQQEREYLISDPCPSCGREMWVQARPMQHGGVYYRKICPLCELKRDRDRGDA